MGVCVCDIKKWRVSAISHHYFLIDVSPKPQISSVHIHNIIHATGILMSLSIMTDLITAKIGTP